MILYFLRHGLAEDRAGWLADDTQRPLTKEGKEKLAQEAEMLTRLNLGLDLNSDYSRFTYYNTDDTWYKSIYSGTPLIRPWLGTETDVKVRVVPATLKCVFSILSV